MPFHRVREAQAHIDPEGSFIRRLRFLNRRRYSVPGPQWLWHIDGNHKLIRLAITIHLLAGYLSVLQCVRGVANDPEISYTFREIRQEIHRNI